MKEDTLPEIGTIPFWKLCGPVGSLTYLPTYLPKSYKRHFDGDSGPRNFAIVVFIKRYPDDPKLERVTALSTAGIILKWSRRIK